MTVRSTGSGILLGLVSAATFATSGPLAKSLMQTGWTPGSVVLLRIAGAALLLLPLALRALGGRWHLLRRELGSVVAYGAVAVALPQLAFFYAVQHLSVGVALLLEYLGLVLVVAWQSVASRALPRRTTVAGIVLALAGLLLVLDVLPLGGAASLRVDPVGVAWGLLAAVGLAAYYLLSGRTHESSLPPLVLAGGGLVVGAVGFAVLGVAHLLPMRFPTADVRLAGTPLPWWVAVGGLALVAAATAYVTGIAAARLLGAKLASFLGLSEVLFAVVLAWLLLGELPRSVQLLGGLLILAGVVVVRAEESSGRGSGVEACRALAVEPLAQGAVVPGDRVEDLGLDVAATQDQSRLVATASQEHRPRR